MTGIVIEHLEDEKLLVHYPIMDKVGYQPYEGFGAASNDFISLINVRIKK